MSFLRIVGVCSDDQNCLLEEKLPCTGLSMCSCSHDAARIFHKFFYR